MEASRFDALLIELTDSLKETPDFWKLTCTPSFNQLRLADKGAALMFLRGKKFTITGDLRAIRIGAFNSVVAIITVDDHSNAVSNSTEVLVEIPKDKVESFLKLYTDTGVKLAVTYRKFEMLDIFVLDEIIEYDNKLNFPYYLCTGDNPNEEAYADCCHHVWGYTSADERASCPLCGSDVIKVYNVYDKAVIKYFNSKHD